MGRNKEDETSMFRHGSHPLDWHIEDEYGRISASDAFKLASRYTSGWSHSIQVVKESHLEHLYLPPHFVAHLPPNKVDVTLSNLYGKSWTIRSNYCKDKRVHYFQAGWKKFIHANEIKWGDVCIIALVGNCKLKVQILKVRDPTHAFLDHLISCSKARRPTSDVTAAQLMLLVYKLLLLVLRDNVADTKLQLLKDYNF
ncbi:B3 domain-containing protein-like protein isoform X1 [Tanacetum coccineum]